MKRHPIITLVLSLTATLAWSAVPAGYYHGVNGKNQLSLLSQLNTICSQGSFLSYGSGKGYTWQGFFYTDRRADGSVIDMYSNDVFYQTDFKAVNGLHIEHALPKSWWGALENYAFRDLHHLFPAEAIANINKNNLPLGETDAPTFDNGVTKVGPNSFAPNTGNCFEPADEYKGDFARAYFYVATTYNELAALWQSPMMNNNTYTVWNDWALQLLLQWHRDDPVSPKEQTRQEAVYGIQHNRNPYIDYPQLIEYIWGDSTGKTFNSIIDTLPYLTTVNRWTSINVPAASLGTQYTTSLAIEGYNFTTNLDMALKGNTPGITLSHTTLTPTQVTGKTFVTITVTSASAGTILDTLQLTSTKLDTMLVPISITFTDEFMLTRADATSATEADIEWMAQQGASTYNVNIYRSYRSTASDLMISAYFEGTSYNKAIALYNGTGRTIDLGYYSIKKQGNGTGAFKNNWQLSGTMVPGSTIILAHASADSALLAAAYATNNNKENNPMSFNGNDAIGLYHNNILIDIIGEEGNSDMWGENIALQRTPATASPSSHFCWTEWNRMSNNTDFTYMTSHTVDAIITDPSPLTFTTSATNLHLTNLLPHTLYTAHVTTTSNSTCNALVFTTHDIQAPEAFPATNITDDSFTANWDATTSATSYIVKLYKTTGSKIVTDTCGFDGVGSCGTPLPEGWTGTASGNYTSAASSGTATPAIALKNDEEWICSPTTSHPITSVQFMYRFASKATGSYIIILAVDQSTNETKIDSIPYTNTTKTTLTYDATTLGANTHAIKIIYHKSAGNLAIDDFIYSYGSETTEYVAEYTSDTTCINIEALNNSTQYSYTVTAVVATTAGNYTSAPSAAISVTTLATKPTTATDDIETTQSHIITTLHNTLQISQLPQQSNIIITDILGRTVVKATASTQYTTTLAQSGIYIVTIKNNNQQQSFKIVIR